MCIRDRYKSIRVNLGISYLFNGVVLIVLYVFCEPLYHLFTTDQAVIDIGVYMLRFLAVSYTHLDVYKRQGLYHTVPFVIGHVT